MEDTKLKLSAIWISQFLLWTFGDMLSLMQEITEVADDSLLLFVATPLAIIQTVMILLPLFCKRKVVRILNLVVPPIFLVFNVMNFFDVHVGWGYLLTIVYVCFNLLSIWIAWQWKPKEE
ncbi:hypothetical protein NEF87_001254 [Candidatus Lokiarchaeum ossiferum]|uniref:Uncharacterized protein n=1 Tax=Candidatus Lokiarchaeum ossiferum TaxID=2951803 RepID=A0ABY6HR57_9ARCH|nr:hypothetical protein NEF87_001254 [Candidatus Lokiarchaeum sp. B-35]